jgi:hypothetical protein
MNTIRIFYMLLGAITVATSGHALEPKRKLAKPEIRTQWADGGDVYYIRANYFRPVIFSLYNKESIYSHLLPQGEINYREDQSKSIKGQELSADIEQTVAELRARVPLTRFTVLKQKEYNPDNLSGAIIMKSNNHPFVVKLFFETPLSFLKPYDKGVQAAVMHRITGGVNRYLAGFTRIDNLERVKDHAKSLNLPMPIDFPRKFYWLPENPRWFNVVGNNFNGQTYSMTLPATYAIVADYIQASKPMSEMRRKYRRQMFATCKACDFDLDPNTKNFKVEDSSQKFVVIDTEHFKTVVGQEVNARNYTSLYIQLGKAGITKGFNNPKPRILAGQDINAQTKSINKKAPVTKLQ